MTTVEREEEWYRGKSRKDRSERKDVRERNTQREDGKYRNLTRISEVFIVMRRLREGDMSGRDEGYDPSGDKRRYDDAGFGIGGIWEL